MDVGRMASLYIIGTEEWVRGNAMIYVFTLKDEVNLPRLARSYEALVRANSQLRVKWVERPETQSFEWAPFSPDELESRLALELSSLVSHVPVETIWESYERTNARLPLRLYAADARTLVLAVHHAWANGYGGAFWFDELFRIYEGDSDAVVKAPASPRVSSATRALRAIVGVFWAIVYALTFALRAGKNAPSETVDLARKDPTSPDADGHMLRAYHFSREETRRVLDRAKRRKLSVAASLVADVAKALFESQPEKTRVCMSLPVDLGGYIDGFSRLTIGNYTGSLILQFRKGGDLASQVRDGFKWFRRGVPYWLTRVMAATAKSEFAARDRFASQAKTANASRAPFENFSCAVSSGGVLQGKLLPARVESLHGAARTQTIYFGAATASDKLCLSVGASRELFDEEKVAALAERTRAIMLSDLP